MMSKVFSDPNLPLDPEGRTFHLGIRKGEAANRVLSVGDHGRAQRLSTLLENVTSYGSDRGFRTYTGTYKGTPVTVIATGMGTPMMDFVVRELRIICDGPMAILRLGTCGGLNSSSPGDFVVPTNGSALVRRDPDAVGEIIEINGEVKESVLSPDVNPYVSTVASPYYISRPVLPDAHLTKLLVEKLSAACEGRSLSDKHSVSVVQGFDVTADSFYSSQGRTNSFFYDHNEDLVNRIVTTLPEASCLQMETFHLLDLARSTRPESKIFASATSFCLVNRHSGDAMLKEDVAFMELLGGGACLDALIEFKF